MVTNASAEEPKVRMGGVARLLWRQQQLAHNQGTVTGETTLPHHFEAAKKTKEASRCSHVRHNEKLHSMPRHFDTSGEALRTCTVRQ